MKVLDAGCGIGGPMRSIARFSGATVVGINLSGYQVERGNYYNKKYKMDKLCSFIHADYMKIPVKDGEFDAIYSVESTCHAPSKLALFKELYRVLKPGGMFSNDCIN
jgi:sterol 24-C-methyltransferase